MASILKVDEMQGVTAADDITVTNGSVTQKLQDGVVSTYSLYDQQNTAVDMSLNVASITDNSTGKYKINLSNNYSTTKEYIMQHAAQSWYSNNGQDCSTLYSISSTSILELRHAEDGTLRDTQYNADSVIGDLA